MNINPSHNVPLIGQQQLPVMQAVAVITPELLERLDGWCKKTGLPFNEIQNTVFRLGLLMVATIIHEDFGHNDPTRLIPLSEAEKKAFPDKTLN